MLTGDYYADYAPVTCTTADPTGASTAATDLAVWQNNIACALPGGQGAVHFPGTNQVQVLITWNDARWAATPADRNSEFELDSVL